MLEQKLARYFDAGFPILYLNSSEEEKCEHIIAKAAGDYRSLIEWSLSNGLYDHKEGIREDQVTLDDVLRRVILDEELYEDKILVLKDTVAFLKDPVIIALLKNFALTIRNGFACNIVILGKDVAIPAELADFVTLLELDSLSEKDICQIVVNYLTEQGADIPVDALLNQMVSMLKGLTETEIQDILALSLSDDGELNSADIQLVFERKRQTIKKSGILEMVQVNETIDDIGGLDNLKTWLRENAVVFKNINEAKAFGVDTPKGVLIAGMPGCGKSLSAKAAAALFSVPLVRMDMGRLMGKYVGESESNMRKAIRLAEEVSPCVLWIDEMEKAFAGLGQGGGGAEVITRLFGTFLTWLQEKKSLAFVVATANDIGRMPPELLRKGRFDEVFYVDLPNPEERKKILDIHLKKRRPQDAGTVQLDTIVSKTNGYSGADLEGIVKDGVKHAFVSHKEHVTTEDIVDAIKNTHSLSETMPDAIRTMREVYKKCKFKNASK